MIDDDRSVPGRLMHNVGCRRVFDVMDLAHVARDHQDLVGLKFHERRWRNKPVHRHRPPANLREDIVHLFNARDALEGDARIKKTLEIDFVCVFLQKKGVLPHDKAPDRMIDRRVIVVTLIDCELKQMFGTTGDRRIAVTDTALRFHRATSLRNKI